MHRVAAVLNARAGSILDRDPHELRALVADTLASHFGPIDVELAHGRRLMRAVERSAMLHDTLIVGGGDGSISHAVALMAGTGKTLGVLPLGTVNLLARDVGMPDDLGAALAALARAEPRSIDVGMLNGRPFHTLSGIGFFSQMARAREESRDLPGRLLRLGVAAMRALGRTSRFTVDVEIDGRARTFDSYAVLVTNNRYDENWRRPALDQGLLEIHVAEDRGALSKLSAWADLVTGGWRDNPGIHSYTAKHLRILGRRRHSWVSTDGELRWERVPLSYESRPKSLAVLFPPQV